jgi:hypothetical protein
VTQETQGWQPGAACAFECEKGFPNHSLLCVSPPTHLWAADPLLEPEQMDRIFYPVHFTGLRSASHYPLHELAHALVAHALGFRVFAIHLGLGKVLFFRKIGGINWMFHLIPSSGVTLVSGPELRYYRLRIFLIHLAGPGIHGLMIAFLIWSKLAIGVTGQFYDLLLWTNILLLGCNLFPSATGGPVSWDRRRHAQCALALPTKTCTSTYVSFHVHQTVSAVGTVIQMRASPPKKALSCTLMIRTCLTHLDMLTSI